MRTIRIVLFLLSLHLVNSMGPAAAFAAPLMIEFEASGPNTALVADAAAAGKRALAIDVGSSISGAHRLKSTSVRLEPGRYQVTVHARLISAAEDDMSRLRFDWTVGDGKAVKKSLPAVWTQFDATPDRYTALQIELTLPTATTPSFDLTWQQVSTGPLDRLKPIRKLVPPTAPGLAQSSVKKSSSLLGGDDDLLGEINSKGQLPPLSSVTYPALLIDHATFEPVGGKQWIETVHPQFLHIYPNQANPVEVQVRNLEKRAIDATLQIEIVAGLDEVLHTATQRVTLAPGSSTSTSSGPGSLTSCRFEWPGGPREFGHAARVTLAVDGQQVHSTSEYFSCSFPIWKTALQGSGFLDWYGREKGMADHVAYNRATYQNVEEAFSWQPSSWTDLNPKTEHWWSGQGDAHNDAAGLKRWLDASHAHGIKMITYLWSTASGPEGIEWGRLAPELVTHDRIGLPTEFFDVEDLRLKSITEADKRLWKLRSGIWNYVGVNRGMLRAIDKGVGETIASAKRFGWDGARFDSPPSWSAMGAEDMCGEFAQLKVDPLMRRLVPEYYKTSGQWSDEAVSVANVRYARHRFQEHDPRFALSYNRGFVSLEKDKDVKFVEACCAEGGQIMDEEIRMINRIPWKQYLGRIHGQANLFRQRGGYHCCVAPNVATAASRCYMALSLFIGGSHPYGDYGWKQPLPGNYAQFMTRYGEYCWAPDLTPTTADEARFSIEKDGPLWWRDLPRKRTLSDGRSQWVVHLLSNPPSEQMMPDKPGSMTPWQRNLVVGRQTKSEPVVWALSAEPSTRATRLQPRKAGDRYVIDVPEHRVWTILVWTEAAS